jgi:hypothetical protein
MKLALVTVALALCAACASSSPAGSVDADQSGDDQPIDASGAGIDGAAPDAPPAGDDAAPPIDAPAIDASAIDGSSPIDAMPIDAMPIDASTCPTVPCDLVEQCGCAANQACDLDFSDLDGTACRGIATPGDVNDTCTAINQCDAGFVCVGDGTDNSCKRYCADDADCGSPRGQCVIQLVDETSTPIPGAITCSSNCDPVAATQPLCPTGWSCDLFTAGTAEIVDCRVAGAAGQGAACSATVACAASFTCVNDGVSDVCGRLCRRPAGTECSASPGTTCFGFTDPFVVGGQEYGVCL